MTVIKHMSHYLGDNWHIGVISGISSFGATGLVDLLTDDKVVKLITTFGAFIGVLIALITFIIKSRELIRDIKQHGKH